MSDTPVENQLRLTNDELNKQIALLEKARKELAVIKTIADEASEFSESVINTIREPLIAIDHHLRVVAASRSFYDVFKVKPEETLGQLIYDLGNKQWDIPRLRELLETILPEKTTFDNYEVEHDFVDIGRRIMLLNARQVQRVWGKERIILLAIEDITERKQLEMLLADSEKRYRRLFETANDGILLLEKCGLKIHSANPAITEILGYSNEDCIGKDLKDVGFPNKFGTVNEIMQTLNEDGIRYFKDLALQKKDRQVVYADIYMVDRASLVQCNIRDITERKRSEEAERERVKELMLLKSISQIDQEEDSCERICQKIAYAVPKIWYHPEIVCSRIIYEGRSYQTENFSETEWCLSAELKVKGKSVGTVEVFYLEERPLRDEGPFLKEERNLINLTTERLEHIIERKQAEKQIRFQAEIIENSPMIAAYHDKDLNVVWINKAYQKATGICLEQVMGKKCYQIWNLSKPCRGCPVIKAIETGENAVHELTPDNQDHWPETQGCWLCQAVPFRDKLGTVIGALEFAIDITERQRSEAELRESEARYERVLQGANDGVWEWDVVTNQVFFSERWKSMIGYKDHELKNDFSEWENRVHPDDIDRCREYIERHLASQSEFFELEHRLQHKDGSYVWILARSLTIRDDEGKPILLTGSHTDLSTRKKAEKELRESEEFNRSIIENSMDCIKILDLDGNLNFMSKGGQQILEIEDINPFLNKSWIDFWKDEDHTNALEAIETAKAGKMGCFEGYSPTAKGTPKWWSVQISPIYGSIGKIKELLSVSRDITEQKRLKDQYNQSQKMESIGTLAGGIAHDFNNILTAIIGNANLALMEVDEDGPLREEIEEIKTAGERAASLTRQLLAFSRKEIIQPMLLDLNELLTNIAKMLGRLIGEDVELLTILEPALWQVEADPGQIEQVIMNLAINARDAMPKGGKLTIETANVDLDRNYYRKHIIKEEQPGFYVMLAVSDTGIGMNEETRERIFEPFFTTKEIGKGTGLGLSTIYGIVKQNNGFIWVYSEPGQGATFKIYLPRNMRDQKPKDKKQIPVAELDGSETVLVVEDDDTLRKLTRTILKQKGYRVLEAENGEGALRISEAYDGSIDLLITDVVMPKMGGRKTAERLQPLYPRMKVIFMSGYTDNAIAHHSILEPGLNFIEKPFSPKALARKVRETLDNQNLKFKEL